MSFHNKKNILNVEILLDCNIVDLNDWRIGTFSFSVFFGLFSSLTCSKVASLRAGSISIKFRNKSTLMSRFSHTFNSELRYFSTPNKTPPGVLKVMLV